MTMGHNTQKTGAALPINLKRGDTVHIHGAEETESHTIMVVCKTGIIKTTGPNGFEQEYGKAAFEKLVRDAESFEVVPRRG